MADTLTKENRDKLKKLGYAVDLLEEDSRRIQEYDFRSPRRFTRDNVRLLNGVYDCFAKTFANKLSGLFRIPVQVDLLSVKEGQYGDFSREVGSRVVMPIIETKMKEGTEYVTNHFAISFPTEVVHYVVNRLLGGDEGAVREDHDFTELELNLIKNFVLVNVTPIIEVAWSSYIDVITTCTGIVLSPGLNKYFSSDLPILNIEFEIVIASITKKFSVCMSFDLLESIFRNFGNRFMGLADDSKSKQKKSLMLEHIKESEVDVSVVLGKTELELGDILALHTGDIVMLDSFTDSSVKVIIKGKDWFSGKIGLYRGRRAVKVTELL
ncbi:MAG: FliM/FliN family flagellar motor switch protein [Oscillospiraceae bacterium]|jgi:flagellar motor switch protein FliM|nr:FliM/FliN family flagellar motor switch protein [Oscillospiraceae bacterium]